MDAQTSNNERDVIIGEMCRLLVVKPKHLAARGIAMDDYAALEVFFKMPGVFTDPAKLAEAKLDIANYKAFLENAGKQYMAEPEAR